MLRYSLVAAVALLAGSTATAGSYDSRFGELSWDFGQVPRGPLLTHDFRVTNNTGQPVHIAGVRVSCGCVTAWALKNDLAPGESTAIRANMDSTRFHGHKMVTIFVSFDRPQWEEVSLTVRAYGKDDFAVNPEILQFGTIKTGVSPTLMFTIAYAHGGQWQILDVEKESNYVVTSVRELKREASGVSYQVSVGLRPDLPAGNWFTDVWVKSNHPSAPRVRMPLHVEVTPPLSISQSLVALGDVAVGKEITKKVILKGDKPFKVTRIEGGNDQLKVESNVKDSNALHVLTITLKPTKPGDVRNKLKVFTDLKDGGEIEFTANAHVIE